MRLFWRGARELADELRRRGHQLIEVESAAKGALLALTKRPDAALVTIGPENVTLAAAVLATRTPLVLMFDGSSRSIEAAGITLVSAMLGAKQLLATDETTAEHTRRSLGAQRIEVFGEGLDVTPLELVDKKRAREAFGLPLEQRFFSLTGPLDEQRLDLVAEAHRRLPGTGLLVAGEGGAGARFVQAMMISARPSAPVLDLGRGDRDARVVAIRAADLAVCAGKQADPEVAALGRRQAALSDANSVGALYPGLDAVHVGRDLLEAMRAALESEDTKGPLPDHAVEAARAKLGDRGGALLEILARAAVR